MGRIKTSGKLKRRIKSLRFSSKEQKTPNLIWVDMSEALNRKEAVRVYTPKPLDAFAVVTDAEQQLRGTRDASGGVESGWGGSGSSTWFMSVHCDLTTAGLGKNNILQQLWCKVLSNVPSNDFKTWQRTREQRSFYVKADVLFRSRGSKSVHQGPLSCNTSEPNH